MKWLWLTSLLLAALFAACGGNGDDPNDEETNTGGRPTPTPTVTLAQFDAQLLTSVVLRAEDLPAGLTGGAAISPLAEDSIAINATYTDGLITIQSSVARYDSDARAETFFLRNRRLIPELQGGLEYNYDFPNLESASAYMYRPSFPDGLATWAQSGPYLVYVHMKAEDKNTPDPRATDEALFNELTALVGERMSALLGDPSLVTPVPAVLRGAQDNVGSSTP
jgi:hypothetical protein